MTEKEATDLYMTRVVDAFNEYYAADTLSIVDQRKAERDAVVAWLRSYGDSYGEVSVARGALLLAADTIEHGEHLMMEKP
tara:strand:+ start:1112 stop:1351 length:240 start_codon:yes stop_codon:yes gene_type:complete